MAARIRASLSGPTGGDRGASMHPVPRPPGCSFQGKEDRQASTMKCVVNERVGWEWCGRRKTTDGLRPLCTAACACGTLDTVLTPHGASAGPAAARLASAPAAPPGAGGRRAALPVWRLPSRREAAPELQAGCGGSVQVAPRRHSLQLRSLQGRQEVVLLQAGPHDGHDVGKQGAVHGGAPRPLHVAEDSACRGKRGGRVWVVCKVGGGTIAQQGRQGSGGKAEPNEAGAPKRLGWASVPGRGPGRLAGHAEPRCARLPTRGAPAERRALSRVACPAAWQLQRAAGGLGLSLGLG